MMTIDIEKHIGKRTYTFSFQGNNLPECLLEAQKLSFDDVYKCGLCNSDNLILRTRIAGKKKFQYTEIKCLKAGCHGTLVLGKTQEDPDTFFLRRNEDKTLKWEAYNPKTEIDED